MWFIYILKCADNSLYTGLTNNLKQRLIDHNNGKGAKFTRSRLPVLLKYFEPFPSKSEARKRESQIKKWSRSKKLALIQQNFADLKQFSISHD